MPQDCSHAGSNYTMKLKALVIGYGSIGKRHSDVLKSMNIIDEVTVMSKQNNVPYKTIKTVEKIKELDPSYIVVASNTYLHYEQLCFLEKILRDKIILVEKPIYERYHDLKIRNNSVWVGYNLRFHPLIQLIKEKTNEKKLWSIHVFCGSYLPDWRPGRNYRNTSSAKKSAGGGVLLDLSHELDYVQWLAGSIKLGYVLNEKVSDLEIETDDMLVLAGESERGAKVHISLNYYTRKPIRQIIIDGEGISIQADLIESTVTVYENGEPSDHAWPNLEKNAIYLAEHEALLSGNTVNACTYDEGMETMSLINSIREWRS